MEHCKNTKNGGFLRVLYFIKEQQGASHTPNTNQCFAYWLAIFWQKIKVHPCTGNLAHPNTNPVTAFLAWLSVPPPKS